VSKPASTRYSRKCSSASETIRIARCADSTAEEYWPDIEGLDHRDTVTDFGLPEGTFLRLCARASADHGTLDRTAGTVSAGAVRGPTVFVLTSWWRRVRPQGFRGECLDRTSARDRGFRSPERHGALSALRDDNTPSGRSPEDTGILHTAARHNRANVGIYASVLEGGTVHRGDSVRLESAHA